MNFSKIMFLTIMFFSTVLVMSSSNWISMWMGMEMNLMAFIPFIYKKKEKKTAQAMMIYFLVQSMGSMIILFSILMNKMIHINFMSITSYLIIIGIMLKLGAAPFHNWFPEVVSNLGWIENLILMTWQKIAPMILLSNFINKDILLMNIILSSMVGAIGGLNTTSLRKIMAYSSINHMSWMFLMMLMQTQWFLYLLIYTLMLITTFIYFQDKKMFYLNQVNSKTESILEKFTISSIMLSMGGLPPFLGFLPKWMVINSMINSNMMMLMLFMLSMSLLTLFYYMRIMSSFMLIYSSIQSWNYKKNKMMTIMFVNFMLPTFLILSFW
uniref:NADH-ubiquinone oxidoreductase chain 2 n=1 Tax=Geocoris pallidipennis TaxID=300797 RepID=B7SMB4_GEOPA|nr:NADH dehydrogenase subunit 2 [Geocoris pallidipennis]ABZ02008.1 NADH dehydrogenase subunit 2 [Geocoris pallidipennis]